MPPGRSPRKLVAVLAYHRIGDPPPEWRSWYYVPEDTFASQLRWLPENGWEIVDDRGFLRGLTAPETLPDRSVLLTFDDGCRSMVTGALPVLRELGMPAVMFVPTDFVGLATEFDRDREPMEEMCTWAELETLRAGGVSIQSHGASHRWFSTLSRDELRDELGLSKEILERRMGSKVDLLAYPYSDAGQSTTETSRLLDRAGFGAAFLCGGGPSVWEPPGVDLFRLDRLAVGPDTDLGKELAASPTPRKDGR